MSEKGGGVHFIKTTIMAAERVQRLNLPITAYMENVERFGQGTNELLTATDGASPT